MRIRFRLPVWTVLALGIIGMTGCASSGARTLPTAGAANADGVPAARSAVGLWEHFSGLTRHVPPPRFDAALQQIAHGATASGRLTYVSDYLANTVTVLNPRAYLVGIIAGLDGPQGLFVDKNRAVWIANTNAQNILVFDRGKTTPKLTLSDAGHYPADVSVCPNGTVYVSNIDAGTPTGGSISVYAGGSINPTGTLHWQGQGKNFDLTCDAAGNVFTTLVINPHTYTLGGAVVEYPGGNQSGATLLPLRLQYPGGIKPLGKNLVVDDQLACTVTEYTEAGTPTGHAITYGSKGTNDWAGIAVTRDGKAVAGADAMQAIGSERAFPTGAFVQTYHVPVSPNGNLVIGIAFDPAQSNI